MVRGIPIYSIVSICTPDITYHYAVSCLIRIGGNNFNKVGAYSPWNFPFDKVPNEQNISSPPIAESNAIEKDPSRGMQHHKKKRKTLGIIALGVGGTALVITLLALAITVHIKRNHVPQHESLNSSSRSMCSFPVSSTGGDYLI